MAWLSIVVWTSQCLAQALTVDLRATSTTSGTIIDPKHVEFTGGVGDTITMDVYFKVSGHTNANPFDDGLDYCWGSFLTSNGGLQGNLSAQLEKDYIVFLAFNGVNQDLDSDGDLDVGSNSTTSGVDYFRAYAGGEETTLMTEDKIATLTWVRSGDGLQTAINFRPLLVRAGAQWLVDGVERNPTNAPYLTGAPVQVSYVPEPGNLMLLVVFASIGIQRR